MTVSCCGKGEVGRQLWELSGVAREELLRRCLPSVLEFSRGSSVGGTRGPRDDALSPSAGRRTEVSPLTSLLCHFSGGSRGVLHITMCCHDLPRAAVTWGPSYGKRRGGDPAERSGEVGRARELQLSLMFCC